MLIDVTLPQLGESVSEGTVSKWLVRAGEIVRKDQPLVSISTDKADSEIPSPASGRIASIVAAEGALVPVRALLCTIEEGATAAATPETTASAEPIRHGTSEGGRDTVIAAPTVRKAALEHDVNLVDVRGSGDRGRVTVDDVLRAAQTTSKPSDPPAAPPAAAPDAPRAPAAQTAQTPATTQLAQLINQTGGFVPPIPGQGFGAFKLAPYRPTPGDQVIPFTRRRRITADHMVYSKFASPHVVTVAEIDLFRTSKLREAHKDRYKKEGMALTMLAFIVVAAAKAIRENPSMNARVIDDAYVIFKDVNIGVAVDSPDGLVVPVVRRADELGVRGIARSIDDVAKRAKGGKITIDDLSGSTFSVTNPGIKGNLFGGAIINQPNVGILRMGEVQKRVVVVEGPDGDDHMAIHPVMYMALSYDHRVVDGVAANAFLWRVTELLEKGEFEV